MTDQKSSRNDQSELVPASTSKETALNIAAIVGSTVPWIGGPVSNVLSGMSVGRKLARVHEVLEGLATNLANFQSEVSERYVRTEEFEDLLEQTLRRAGDERAEEKRRLYRQFLVEAIQSPGERYDEQMRFLRTLEDLQADHIRVLKALAQEPDPKPGSMSPDQTLRRRLPELDEARIGELVGQLNDMHLSNLVKLNIMMTARGAEDLRDSITPYGKRFLGYIKAINSIVPRSTDSKILALQALIGKTVTITPSRFNERGVSGTTCDIVEVNDNFIKVCRLARGTHFSFPTQDVKLATDEKQNRSKLILSKYLEDF